MIATTDRRIKLLGVAWLVLASLAFTRAIFAIAQIPSADESWVGTLVCWQPATLGHFEPREIRGRVEVS